MRAFINAIILAAVMFASAACISDRNRIEIPEVEGASETDVVLRLKTPDGFSSPKSRALTYADENTIADVYVLVFDANEELVDIKKGEGVSDEAHPEDNPGQITHPEGPYSGAGSFSVVLPESTESGAGATSRLVVLANAENILDARGVVDKDDLDTSSPLVGRGYGDVIAAIYDAIAGEMYASGPKVIPMWGETEQIQIVPANKNQSVTLMRAIARVDVGVGATPVYNSDTDYPWEWDGLDSDGDPVPFELTSVHVIRASNRYSIVPAPGGITPPSPTKATAAPAEPATAAPTEAAAPQPALPTQEEILAQINAAG
ncbi:MAG: hypothetical protein LBU97_04270, partial [Alistipes sp.]|nr:hypothetical protein [Alistipes sp.]